MPSYIPAGADTSVKVNASPREPKRVSTVKVDDKGKITQTQKVIDQPDTFSSDVGILIEYVVPEDRAPGVIHDNVVAKVTKSSSSSKKSSSSKSSSSKK